MHIKKQREETLAAFFMSKLCIKLYVHHVEKTWRLRTTAHNLFSY